MNTQAQRAAALAWAAHIKDYAQCAADAESIPAGDRTPILIEGRHTNGRELRVTLPSGAVWLYDLPIEGGIRQPQAERVLLVNLQLGAPRWASVFRPTGDGIHPFVGVATRIGIEKQGGQIA